MTRRIGLAALILVGVLSVQGPIAAKDPYKKLTADERMRAIRHAQVWMPVDVKSVDIKTGPRDVPGFAADQTVFCDWVSKKSGGGTPKFWCEISVADEIRGAEKAEKEDPDAANAGSDGAEAGKVAKAAKKKDGDVVKVKYGEKNGEVYGEVAATRLLWALGFGADRMYPVKVECRGCSDNPFDQNKKFDGERPFDPASIERQMPGYAMESHPNSGWNWLELDNVDQTNGGAPLAHRHALKLLAVFIQHTDSKESQQRLVCLDDQPKPDGSCEKPFMMLNDLGRTFGKANTFNRDIPGSVDLKAWASMPVWKGAKGCEANLPKSMTGTLANPRISDEGRRFLADLLMQLSDQQIRDLFEVARFTRRQPDTTVDDWVNVFKDKREQITSRTCAS